MPATFNFSELGEPSETLLRDCATKLSRVPFPVEAARTPVVMHYDPQEESSTLIFLCNAYIHKSRIKPPAALRIKGVSTRKFAAIVCTDFTEEEVAAAVNTYTQAGYCAYSIVVNGNTKLYISWDERCLTAPPADEVNI